MSINDRSEFYARMTTTALNVAGRLEDLETLERRNRLAVPIPPLQRHKLLVLKQRVRLGAVHE